MNDRTLPTFTARVRYSALMVRQIAVIRLFLILSEERMVEVVTKKLSVSNTCHKTQLGGTGFSQSRLSRPFQP